MNTMKTQLVKMGSVWAVLLPEDIVSKAGLLDEVEITVGDRQVSLKAAPWDPAKTFHDNFRQSLDNGEVGMRAGEW